MIYYAPVRPNRRTSIIDSWKLEIMENCNVYRDARQAPVFEGPQRAERSGGSEDLSTNFLAKRIRAHDGCLGIGRRRRTRKTATSSGEPSTGFDPEVSEWDNPAPLIGCRRRMNT